ncbi:phage portal protein [Gordonia alkaliphila]|uniref:Portal protein n=1 Tax=Gordonia alkaliphila TaxID=1053547 RepID=A0ABP8ZGA2_9ACTN
MRGAALIKSPVDVPRVPGLSESEQAALARLDGKVQAHRARNALRTALYEGKHALDHVGTVIPTQYRRAAQIIGWPAKAVDLLADRCTLTSFDWPDGDAASLGLDTIWTGNQLAIEAPMAAVSSLQHGVAFLSATEGDVSLGEQKAQIHCTSAADGSGEWNPRTRSLDSFLEVHKRDDLGAVISFTLIVGGQIVTADRDRGVWSVDRSTYRGMVPVEPLVFRPRPSKRLGTSRISRPVIGLTTAAMRTAMRLEGNADVYSLPQLFLLGANSSIFKNPDGTIKAAWQVALGRMFGVPDDDKAAVPRADIRTVQAASPEPHLKQMQQYAQLFSGETAIPVSSLGVSDMANPNSAESYIASREDLIAIAEVTTDIWGAAWARTMMRAAAIGNGVEVDERWSSIMPLWRPPQHQSRAAMADAGAKQVASVPWLAETEVGLELVGLTPDQITRALAARDKARSEQAFESILTVPDTPAAEDAGEDAADDADPAA